MAEFFTKCPHCNRELKAQEEWIGMAVECPYCKETFTITANQRNTETPKSISVKNDQSFIDKFIGGIISFGGNIDWEAIDKNMRKVFISIGSVIFIVLGIAFCIGGFVLGSKYERSSFVIIGICLFIACIFLAYFGKNIFKCGDKSIPKNRNAISSMGLLNCIFIFFFFAALGLTVTGIVLAYEDKSIQPFYTLFIGAFSSFAISIVALKPQLVNLHIDENTSTNEDWISILVFFAKGNLFIAPYYWSVFLAIICINLIVRLGADVHTLLFNFMTSIPQMIIIGVSPLLAYLTYLGVNFTLNISRAILSIPQKLDAIAAKKE